MPSPNAEAASRRALLTASASSAGSATSRMPRPPPPKAALTSSGKPTAAPAAETWSRSVVSVTVAPGRTGTPASAMIAFARTLEPIASMASGRGPTKVSPASAQARANPAFSERNP